MNEIFITVQVTNRAGNVAVTNFTVALDYTGATNPPVVQLLWPLAGMAVSGSNVTLRGTMSDESKLKKSVAADISRCKLNLVAV